MIRNRIWVIALLLCGAACTSRETPEDVAIFQAIVEYRPCDFAKRGGYYIVSDRPASLHSPLVEDEWSKWLPDPRVRSASLARAEQRRKWPLLTPCGSGVRIVDDAFVEGLFERHKNMIPRPWTSFYEAFPGSDGLYRISAPVLDADGTAALVHMYVECDVLCGAGFLVKLKKESGRWQVVQIDSTWIS